MVEKVFYQISAIPLVRVSFCGVPFAMCVYIYIFFHVLFMYSSLVFYLQIHFCLSIGLCHPMCVCKYIKYNKTKI